MEIPKIIHYCWFGPNEKTKEIKKTIENWKSILPEYEIIEWNEKNFPYEDIPYAYEAYKLKKYAFVADVARIYALKNLGGIYLDTDVKILKPFDSLINNENLYETILGFELNGSLIGTNFIASISNSNFLRRIWKYYLSTPFVVNNNMNLTPNTVLFTNFLKKDGLICNNKIQKISRNIIYSSDYFSAYDPVLGLKEITSKTYCIHLFNNSWSNPKEKIKLLFINFLVKLCGVPFVTKYVVRNHRHKY